MVLAMGHEWWRGGTAPGSVGLRTEPVLVTSARPRFASPPPRCSGFAAGAGEGGGHGAVVAAPRTSRSPGWWGQQQQGGGELCRSQRCGNLKRRWLGTRLHERWHWGRAQPPRPPPPLRVREANPTFGFPFKQSHVGSSSPGEEEAGGGGTALSPQGPRLPSSHAAAGGSSPPAASSLSLSLCPSPGGSLREEKNTTTKQDEDAPAAAMPSPKGTATGSAVVPLPTPRTRARGEPPRSAAASLRPGCGRGRKISSAPGGGRLHPAPLRS